MTDHKLAQKRCAACGNAKPVSEMKICMHNQMHRYVCDSKCMNDFYNPPKNLRHDAAAPAVQGEPVAVVDADDDGMWADILPNVTVKVGQALYAAPQPAERQPDVQGYVMVPAKEFESVLNRADWRTAKNRAELRHMLKALQSSAAPDVAGLVEALSESLKGIEIPSVLTPARAEFFKAGVHAAVNQLNTVLDAHRKQGGE